MKDVSEEMRKRMEAVGENGKQLSLLAGTETLDELKYLILQLTRECPAQRNHPHCPFRLLAGLSYGSAVRMINDMSRETCLNLFELELNCRSQAQPPDRPSSLR